MGYFSYYGIPYRILCKSLIKWGGALRDDTKNGCVGD